MTQDEIADLDDRIRRRAYDIWQNAGCPDGQAERHWTLAAELVAIEDSGATALMSVSDNPPGPFGEPIEPISAVTNQGSFPTMTDQDEAQSPSPAKAPKKRPTTSAGAKPKTQKAKR